MPLPGNVNTEQNGSCSNTTSAVSQPSHSPLGPTPETPRTAAPVAGILARGDTGRPLRGPPGGGRGAGGGQGQGPAALDRLKIGGQSARRRIWVRGSGSGSEHTNTGFSGAASVLLQKSR